MLIFNHVYVFQQYGDIRETIAHNHEALQSSCIKSDEKEEPTIIEDKTRNLIMIEPKQLQNLMESSQAHEHAQLKRKMVEDSENKDDDDDDVCKQTQKHIKLQNHKPIAAAAVADDDDDDEGQGSNAADSKKVTVVRSEKQYMSRRKEQIGCGSKPQINWTSWSDTSDDDTSEDESDNDGSNDVSERTDEANAPISTNQRMYQHIPEARARPRVNSGEYYNYYMRQAGFDV
jgi:hypothetical protein